MTVMFWTYMIYVFVSVALTVWVARTLHKNGRRFLVDRFGHEGLADSVNHLLVVGFYLINVGYISLALKYGDQAVDSQSAIEVLSTKVGLVLVILGVMHFLNLYVFSRFRRRTPPAPAGEANALLPEEPGEPDAEPRKRRWTYQS